MNALDDDRKREAARWFRIAIEDQAVARICLNMSRPSVGIAAYHCQQSIEKMVKGMLVVAGIHFPKTHDLRALADLAEVQFPAWRALFTRSIPLTGWGFAYRYPGLEDDPPPDTDQLTAALAIIDELSTYLHDLIAPYGD
jgi:HEPN domain-containing protein